MMQKLTLLWIIGLMFLASCANEKTKEPPYRRFVSPTGDWEVLVVRKKPIVSMVFPGFPGSSGDFPGIVKLRNIATDQIVASCKVSMVSTVNQVTWSASEVDIKLLATWSLK